MSAATVELDTIEHDAQLTAVIDRVNRAHSLDEIHAVAHLPLAHARIWLKYDKPDAAQRCIDDANAVIDARLIEWRDLADMKRAMYAERAAERAALAEAVAR